MALFTSVTNMFKNVIQSCTITVWTFIGTFTKSRQLDPLSNPVPLNQDCNTMIKTISSEKPLQTFWTIQTKLCG